MKSSKDTDIREFDNLPYTDEPYKEIKEPEEFEPEKFDFWLNNMACG